MMVGHMGFTIDFEVTNRCNAECHFCPRDQTPHEGLMTPEVFDAALERAVEYAAVAANLTDSEFAADDPGISDIIVSLCGLGEPLINKHTPSWIRAVKDAGFTCAMSSNGGILDERRGAAVLDAGLDQILINVGDIGSAYEDVYKLPWERTRDNITAFVEAAGDDCQVFIVLVDYRQDADHVAAMKDFWRERGVTHFQEYGIMNRGGALFVDHMQFDTLPQRETAQALLDERGGRAICGTPFAYLFVGYDGNYYLCCSDWKKEVPLGTVFDRSFVDLIRPKLEHVLGRGDVCRTCNLDPLNYLTDEIRAHDAGQLAELDADRLADEVIDTSRRIEGVLEELHPGVTEGLAPSPTRRRRRIPLLNR